MSDNIVLKPRVAILSNSEAPLHSRWAAPFERRGFEVDYILPRPETKVDKLLSSVDGVLLTGGNAHIHPFFSRRDFNSLEDPGGRYDLRRDITAIDTVQAAYKLKIPTLGICRGMQEIVAAYGGPLANLEHTVHGDGYQHIGDLEKMDTRIHDITFPEGTRLREIFRAICDENGRIAVNSIHYEGMTREGWDSAQSEELRKVFTIGAVADDGVIEGIYAPDMPFYMGLQPHFELSGPLHDALFDEFEAHIRVHHARHHGLAL